MTEQDLIRVESTVNVRLPRAYRELLLRYPFPPGSAAAAYELPNDPDVLIEMNSGPDLHEMFATDDRPPPPLASPFQIGHDGGEEWYYIDTALADSPVYKLALELWEVTVHARSLTEYVVECQATEEEIRRQEEAAMRRPPWWQFWRHS